MMRGLYQIWLWAASSSFNIHFSVHMFFQIGQWEQIAVPLFFFFSFFFFTFLEVTLVDITFSIEKEENLAMQIFSKDSMTMNLGKSAASFSKSNTERLFFCFFFYEESIGNVNFLLILCSTIYHGVQLELRIYQAGNPFALIETRLLYQYIQTGSRVLNPC